MFNITDRRPRFAFKKHALGHRSSGEFDAAVERVQVDIGRVVARLAVRGRQGQQLVAKLRHIVAVITEGNTVARSPDKTAVLAVRIRINGRAAERMPEQARADRMPRFMDHNPLIVVLRAAVRREEFVVLSDSATSVSAREVARSVDRVDRAVKTPTFAFLVWM